MKHEAIDIEVAKRWCILRTSGGRTLRLAASLGDAGFEVWTPAQTITRRRPRSKATIDIHMPILPTFVFARADRTGDLQAVAVDPASRHPPFSIFRHAGQIPLVADGEIAGLRAEEDRGRVRIAKQQRRLFALGSSVRVESPAFGGMTGVVETSDGKQALVSFGGGFRVKIDAWLLHPVDVETAELC